MPSARQVRTWYKLHKWTSHVCTLFLLISCLTGLPLIFHDEIDQLTSPETSSGPAIEIPPISLDQVVTDAKKENPSLRTLFITMDENAPHINVGMASGLTVQDLPRQLLVFDAYSGKQMKTTQPGDSLMDKLLLFHRGLFSGVPGELFMGVMALLFVISLVSGALVYGPFMRRLDFGTVRKGSSRRIHWFDLHNILGIVTVCWTLVVGATGIMNALNAALRRVESGDSTPAIGFLRKQAASTKGHHGGSGRCRCSPCVATDEGDRDYFS